MTSWRDKPVAIQPARPYRAYWYRAWLAWLLLICVGGCTDGSGPDAIGRLDATWGRRGLSGGRFQKPRALAIDAQDQLYVVDMTARIQVFDNAGTFLRSWQTPVHTNGRPTGLTIDRQGRVLVADTHYFRVLFYDTQGKLLKTLGGTMGSGPGEFGLVTDIAEDKAGNLYVAEYGEFDRIQKFNPEGKFIKQWGGQGSEPGQFVRPQNMKMDQNDHLWVADACNHRIQVFDTEGNLLKIWGNYGELPGELCYPYDLAFDEDGNVLICEYGNHRVQKFTPDGESLGCWGHEGHKEGELFNPWALVHDSHGKTHVLDSGNHRVQRVNL